MSIVSLQLVRTWGSITPGGCPAALQNGKLTHKTKANSLSRDFVGRSSDIWIGRAFVRDVWSASVWHHVRTVPLQHSTSFRSTSTRTRASSVAIAEQSKTIAISTAKAVAAAVTRGIGALQRDPLVVQCGPAVALMAFSIWGLGPTLRFLRTVVRKDDAKWSTSRTQHVMSSYIRPVCLWVGVILLCRAFDPVVLSSEASHAVKGRFINFVRALSTVLAFAFCTASLTQYIQKTMMESQDKEQSRNIGVQFVGNTVYTSVWIAAVCLFMELLGFSTQKLITAGGFGTVLLTLAGREIFTNFLSSVMIHATRPFIENEWIQTKIEGQEVSGTVEHVGWWSPTVIRGDDREAVHIPNHKFTVSVVRNLSQKTHWRIKTHFGISHLDVGKVADIVSDMRKVISKHPQVEQRRLHRRAFFDNVDPENQALLILVSCFVKTSHFEEYLRVKELILLDMLRVIGHHNARLATPIRSVQRIFDESETRQAPFREDTSPKRKQPRYMIEAGSVAVSNDVDEENIIKMTPEIAMDSSAPNDDITVKEITGKESEVVTIDAKAPSSPDEASDPKIKTKPKDKSQVVVMADANPKSGASDSTVATSAKPQLEGLDSMGLNSNDITLLKAAFEKPPTDFPDGPLDSPPPHVDIVHTEKDKAVTAKASAASEPPTSGLNATSEAPTEVLVPSSKAVEELAGEKPQVDDPWREPALAGAPQKPDSSQSSARRSDEKAQAVAGPQQAPSAAPVPRLQSVEENLVLGVALDGPKRTLPLDDDDMPAAAKPRELVTSRNGGGSTPPKERRDPSSSPQPNPPGATTPSESRAERER